MRKFAEIPVAESAGFGQPGVVKSIFDWPIADRDPEYAPGTVVAVDVTGLEPAPDLGWTYDAASGTFTAPPPREPEPAPAP